MNHNDLEQLQEAYALRGIALHQLHERVTSLEQEIAQLKELLRLQQERIFGKTSETAKSILEPTTPLLDPLDPIAPGIPPITVAVAAHVRVVPPRGPRQLDTSTLPKYTKIHDLPETEKICLCCGGALHFIGQEKSEQLEIIPVKYCVIEHLRLKYGCRPCDSLIMAPKPQAPIPKAIAGAGLLDLFGN